MAEEKIATAFTTRELQLLAGAFTCLKSGDMAIDYKKFAEFGGFANANSAKASWNNLRKKLQKTGSGKQAEAADNDTASPKRKHSDVSNEDGAENSDTGPKKKTKKSPGQKAKKQTKVEVEEEEYPAEAMFKTEPKADDEVVAEDEDGF